MRDLKIHFIVSFTIICLFTLTLIVHPQTEKKDSILLPVRVKEKWGYINEKGKIVIKPRFWAVGDFSEGLAEVRDEEGRFYYIDKTGKSITNGKTYRFADDFSEGLAAVQENPNDKIGFINRSGSVVIKPRFDSFTGKIIGSFTNDLNYVYLNGKIGFIDKRGNFVIKPIFDGDTTLNATPFSERLATIRQ
ncbi:MAG: WG repeat-containing protein, partial [Acidobacteriota bacterium]